MAAIILDESGQGARPPIVRFRRGADIADGSLEGIVLSAVRRNGRCPTQQSVESSDGTSCRWQPPKVLTGKRFNSNSNSRRFALRKPLFCAYAFFTLRRPIRYSTSRWTSVAGLSAPLFLFSASNIVACLMALSRQLSNTSNVLDRPFV